MDVGRLQRADDQHREDLIYPFDKGYRVRGWIC